MKRKTFFKAPKEVIDFLTLNRSEQRGIMVLSGLLIVLLMVNKLDLFAEPEVDQSLEFFIQAIEKFEATRVKKQSLPPTNESDTNHRNFVKPPSFTIAINQADTFDFQRLSGIGPAFARRIVAYRERLGGFVSKNQLLEVWGMDSSRYSRIERFIIIGPDTVKKVSLNNATFKELLRHPYFTFDLAKEVMLLRKKNRRIDQMDEIRTIRGMSDSLFLKLSPYLKVE